MAKNTKSIFLSFRATEDEQIKVRAMGRVLGLSASEVLRLMVRGAQVEATPRVSAFLASANATGEVAERGERR